MRHHLLGRVQRAVLPLFLLSCLASAYGQSGAAQESDSAPFAYAAKLISQMTLEEKAAQMQDQAPAIPRLGIAAYGWWNEGLHGVANAGYATNFPQAIGLAATWDTALIQAVAEAISVEARAKHDEAIRQGSYARFYGLTFWSPSCLVPGLDGAYFSERQKEALWDRFFTRAPARQRQCVERYSIVKRA